MTNDTTNTASTASSQHVTGPIGGRKAEIFAAVDGLTMSPDAKALSQRLTSSGLQGDAYRLAVMKAFKKG